MAARSVDSECKSCVMEPRKYNRCWSLRHRFSGGNIMSLYLGLVNIVWPGSENRANAQWGSQGTWEIPLSPLNESGRNKPVEQVPGLWMVLSGIHGTKHQRAGVVPTGKGNGAIGMDTGSLSPFIVPLKAGKLHPKEPVSREGRGRVTEPFLRNTEVHRDRWTCQRNRNG